MQKTEPSRINKLLKLYYRPLFHSALQLCGNPARAMALTQRTFRQAFEFSRSLPVPANRRAWLFTILFDLFLQGQTPQPQQAGAL